jgi:hypothetical protein
MPRDEALGMAWEDMEASKGDEEGSGKESIHQ